jgi:DNA-binding XRE family transcriptional regulator
VNQRELASRLEVATSTVSRLASGQRTPRWPLIYKIAGVLGWPAEEQLDAIYKRDYAPQFKKRMEQA